MKRAVSLAVLAAAAIAARAVADKTPPQTPALLAAGKAAYEDTIGCVACHGPTGEGNGKVAFAIKPPPRNFTKDPFKNGDSVEQIFATISHGLPGTSMAPYPQVPEADRWALAYYVRSFRPKP